MENSNAKLSLVALGALTLAGCNNYTNPPEYFPGYYQEAKYHEARYERPYYDYYGNYHAAYIAEPYEEKGRWHRASVLSTDNIGKAVYVMPVEMEAEGEEDVAHIAADKNNVRAVVE